MAVHVAMSGGVDSSVVLSLLANLVRTMTKAKN
jgi:tRNA U34 2-thiouridine synthase MnmA/TrmU